MTITTADCINAIVSHPNSSCRLKTAWTRISKQKTNQGIVRIFLCDSSLINQAAVIENNNSITHVEFGKPGSMEDKYKKISAKVPPAGRLVCDMKIGFTGTRKGMNHSQQIQFSRLIVRENPSEFHHGDCVGSDEMAHNIVRANLPNCKIIIHPCTLAAQRAYCVGDVVLPVKAPLDRNHDIVDACDILIASPETDQETLRSGTWATYRYAKGKKHTILIVPE